MILIYARTCWQHAISHIRCAPQVLNQYSYTHGHVGHMPYPVSVAHRKWMLYLYLFELFEFLYKNCDSLICTDMLATCRIPCPLRTASEYFIYTYLNYFDLYIKIVIFLYARTCWPHAVSRVRCAPQVNVIFIPIWIIWVFI